MTDLLLCYRLKEDTVVNYDGAAHPDQMPNFKSREVKMQWIVVFFPFVSYVSQLFVLGKNVNWAEISLSSGRVSHGIFSW